MNSRPRLHHMYDHTLFCISIHFHDCDIDQIICEEWLQMAEFLKRFIQGKLQTWAASEFREFSVITCLISMSRLMCHQYQLHLDFLFHFICCCCYCLYCNRYQTVEFK